MPNPTPGTPNAPILSVSQLNRLARMLLEESFPSVLVEGEISNFARPSSGHWYLTLKDEDAQVRCAMFRNRNMFVRLRPRDGMKVLVKARLSLYEGRGDYQLILEHLEETGAGALRRTFDQLKEKLQQEGLFDMARKRPLPALPRHLAVITSPSGAAIRDVLSVLRRRFPALPVTIVPVLVQGEQAAAELIRALALVNAGQGCLADVDLVLLTRGGGSLEDLWSFNDEGLARAIAASTLPVISAVGHESDFTIADFVADLRAPTPSAAAELLSPHQEEYRQQLQRCQQNLLAALQARLLDARQQLQYLRKQLRHPGRRLQEQAQRLDGLELRCRRAMQQTLQHARQRLALLQARLLAISPQRRLPEQQRHLHTLALRLQRALGRQVEHKRRHLREQSHALHTVSPLATLARGYALTTLADGTLLTAAQQVEPGTTIHTRLASGRIASQVTERFSD